MAEAIGTESIEEILRRQREAEERARAEAEKAQAEAEKAQEQAAEAAAEGEKAAQEATANAQAQAEQAANNAAVAGQIEPLGLAPAQAEGFVEMSLPLSNPVEPKGLEAPDPMHTGVRSRGLPRVTQEDKTDAQFMRHVRDSVMDTGLDVVSRNIEPGRYEGKTKAQKQSIYASRLVGHAAGLPVKATSGDKTYIDYDNIKTKEQGFGLMMVYTDDAAKEKGAVKIAKQLGMNPEAFIAEVENYMDTHYGRQVFSEPHSQMAKIKTYNQGLANQGLMDVDGNMLNMATATQPQIEQAIRLEPDPDNRKNAIAYYGKLCEARGWTYNKDSLGFMDSADMTQKDYNAAVSEYNELFSIGYSDANRDAYLEEMAYIQTQGYIPRVQKQMEAALKKSYEARTGYVAPTFEEIQAASEQEITDEQKPSFWDSIADADKKVQAWLVDQWTGVVDLFSGKGEAEKPKEDPLIAEEESAEGEAPKQQPIMAGGTVSMGGQTMNVSQPLASAGAMPPKSEMFDVDAISSPSILNVLPGEQQEEPAQQTGTAPEASEAKPQYIREVPYDPNMTDEQALAEYKKGGTLDPRNREQIAWYVDDKVASGVSYGLNPKDVNWGTGNDIYDTTQYWQYGKSIGSAAKVLNSGILTDDMQNSAELALGRVIKTIREDVANPEKGISVPANQNMMEYVLNLPQYSGLKNTVQSINDAQKQIIEINAENEIKAKEERKQEVQTAIETLKAGLGTPDLLDFVKGEFDSTKVDFNSDGTYQQYKNQLSHRSTYFFDDNGAFWNGDSAAAAEGKNLRTLGEGYGEFKSALKMQTEQVLEDYTVSAMSMGMTLDELLGSMGIDSVDQVIDIAYNNMQTVGNKFASDVVAQETAQAVAENPQSIGYVKAGAAGGLLAFKSTNKGILETAYMTVSDATYKQNVQDLRNDFRAQYGEAAPHMYYSAIMAKIDSGELSQQAAAELLSDMNRVDDIFELGYVLDDGFLETLLRNPADSLQKDIEEIGGIIDKLPENEKKVANAFSMLVSTGYGMALSTSVGMVAGAPVFGSAVAYGMPAYSDTRRDMKMKGATKGTGHWFALANAAATTALNTGTTGAQTEIWGDLSWMTMQKKLGGKGGAELWRQIGTFVKNQAASEGLEEVNEAIKDVAFDAASKAVIAYEKGEVPRLSDALGLVIDNVSSLDMADTGMEVLKSYGAGFLMGGIMTLGGVATSGIVTGAKMSRNYESIKMSAQMVNGEIPFTEENVGKAYELVQKDLQNPEYCRWIDKANATAREQNNMVTAAMMGVGNDARQAAVKNAARANDYRQKEASAKDAAETATKRWVELRQQVMDGNLDMVPMMTTAQQQMAKAHTTHIESGKAADKAEADAAQSVREWLAACGAYKSESMKFFANRAIVQRQLLAEELQAKYEAEEAAKIEEEKRRDAETSHEVAYAEGAVFAEDDADMAESEEEALDTMSDEDLDREIETLGAQIVDAEARVADATARREELGLDGETIQQLVDQELTPLASRKERIIAREKSRFNDIFGRQQQLFEMDNDEGAEQLQEEYNAVANRLIGLGADVDSLVMEQYGITPEQLETAQEAEQPAPVEDETERLTDSLARRMEETNTGLETINSARRYLASTPIYVNESQAADILSEEGLKSISQVNRRYGTKLTTDEKAGAMPLDGHVLTDINDETPGVVDVAADPVGEALRILRSGKELTARQKSEKLEAKELREKKKNVKQRRAEKVDALVKPIKTEEDAKKANDSASSVIKITPEHTNKQQKDIIAYHSAVNSDMYNAAQTFKANPGGTNKRILISEVKDREANDILNLTGVDVAGYVHAADRGFFTHVERRHGENGDHDKTMSALEDVARVGWVIDNYDSVELLRDSNGNPEKSKAYRDKHDQPEMLIRYKKQLDGSVYVVEAVGENKWKRLWLVTAYIQKNGPVTQSQNQAVTQAPHAVNQPLGNARNAVASPATSSVAQGSSTVNTNSDIDAMTSSGSASSAQQASQQKTRSKKAEASALKALQNLAKDMKVGLRIKSGQRFQSADARMSSGVLGYYKNGQRNAIVRSAEAGRLDVTGHEIGHAVQEQLGIKSNQQMISNWQSSFGNTAAYTPAQYDHEAFAEFFWRYLEGRNLAVSYAGDMFVDSFEQALRQKKLYKAVNKAQMLVSAYMSSEADAKIRSRIVNASEANKQNDGFNRRVVAIIDDTAAAEPLQNVIRARTGEKALSLEDNLRDTIRFNRRAGARAAEIMTTALVDQNGDAVGESMKEALSDVKGKDFDLFWEWMLAKHSIARDNAKGAKNQVFDEETIPTAEREAFIKAVEKEHPEFLTANDRFQKWRRLFMDTYLVNNGFLGENGAQLMDVLDAMYPNYVPTYRAKQKNDKRATLGGRNYQMRTATGSTEDVINPFDSFVTMVNSIVQMTADNDSKLKFADLYDRFGAPLPGETGAGFGWFANELTQDMQRESVTTAGMREKIEKILDDIGTDPDVIMQIGDIIGDEKVEYHGTGRVNLKNVITVRNADGSKRYFEIYDPDLFTLLSGTNTMNQKGALDGLAHVTRMMSMLTTGSNPIFGVTNALRDFQNSVNYGSWAMSYTDGAVKWLGALWDVLRNGETSKEYDALGGGGWTAYDTKTRKGAEQIRGEVFKGYNTSNVGRIGKMIGRKIWKAATFEKINEAIEKTSRLAEYKYGKHDLSTTEGRIEAFLAAQDVTTDFARRGNGQIARDLKNLIPFFNASMQGVYRNARQFTAQESDRAKTRFAKNIINSALASALANAMLLKYMDDDEKEEFIYLSDDLKAKHMFLPNFAPDIFGNAALIRIPIDQNPVSYAVNAAVSNFIWKGETDNEFVIELGAVADVIMDNLNPFGSTILDPAISIISNKNWYGGNIVPTYLESYDETNQYTEETPTPFVTFSKGLAQAGIKISPMMLQYIAEQYTGYVGQTLIPALPSEKNDNGFIGGVLNALVATARKRVTTDPLASNGVVSGVYDSFNALQAVYKAGNSKRGFDIDYLNPKLNDMERRRAVREADDLIHSGGDVYDAKKEISAGYDKIDEINDRDDLTDEEKHVLIQRVRRDMVETALDVREIMNDYDARYKNNGVVRRFLDGIFLN